MSDVEPVPAEAAGTFGPRLDLAERYAGLLADEAVTRGLVGPGELPRLWSRHLLNSAVVAELIPNDVDLIDVGSGAGLPGLPLAIARPDLSVVLVEPLLRRSTWLADVIERLGLAGQVQVRRARAEQLAGALQGTFVTARAVAPMDRLAGWCLPLVRPGGQLLAIKGRTARSELDDARAVIERLGGEQVEVLQVRASPLADPVTVVQVKVGASAPPIGRTRAASGRSDKRKGGGGR
jgi:16S rRNA (guanine527-N7)-methyltransferase